MSGLTAYISEAAAGKENAAEVAGGYGFFAFQMRYGDTCRKFTHPDVKVYLQRKIKRDKMPMY